ncbi:MAG: radical SAM protein [Nitrospirota bacterium]|nr:radical SAM protein [Nitrospirota bacterium]
MPFLSLGEGCTLKRLEQPYLYNISKDELYEMDEEAFGFLSRCNRGEVVAEGLSSDAAEFVDYGLDEGLLVKTATPESRRVVEGQSSVPSLRYLELQISNRCNLFCTHCYLGDPGVMDMPPDDVFSTVGQFEEMQGLRLLLSGGEPMMHRNFWAINERLPDYSFRSILLTNGTLITHETARRLKVHEVQVSLDGMEDAHDSIRGEGTFGKIINGIRELQEVGIAVSVATMITTANRHDLPAMQEFLAALDIREWNVDVPCPAGRLDENKDLLLSPKEAGTLMQYGFGGYFHGSTGGYVCGAHLCAMMPDTRICRCGFYADKPLGFLREGLRTCWERLKLPKLDSLTECTNCAFIEECHGGCRYRAEKYGGSITARDPIKCWTYAAS